MPDKSPTHLPKYRHYKPKNLAVVRLDGRVIYLGPYDSDESREKYRRVVAEWLAGKPATPLTSAPGQQAGLSVAEVLLAFLDHAESHYRKPCGAPSPELQNVKDAIRPVRKLYARTAAREFGPLALRAVRDEMVRSGLARTTINARINRIRRVFKWAASVELVPATVTGALVMVAGLQRGRTKARETTPIGPVPVERVEATLAHVPRPVAAMVRLQLLTGCRAGEITIMRGCDLVTTGEA